MGLAPCSLLLPVDYIAAAYAFKGRCWAWEGQDKKEADGRKGIKEGAVRGKSETVKGQEREEEKEEDKVMRWKKRRRKNAIVRRGLGR